MLKFIEVVGYLTLIVLGVTSSSSGETYNDD